MIDLYTWDTPNGRKISIALEELGIPYTVHPVDITKGHQSEPEFTAISLNQKIPAIVDHETGIRLMESGAILLYLADKTGKLMPGDRSNYWEIVEWLMWQKASLGPMLGQLHHFVRFNKGKSAYAEERYLKEARRLYDVLNHRLADRPYIAGDEYSIADIAAWPWVSRFEYQTIDLAEFPNVLEWYVRIAQRPAVHTGYAVPAPDSIPMPPVALS
jgi:GST-like protein